MDVDFLSKNEMLIFMDIAAAAGLTIEQLVENFIKDIVSAFSCGEISESENKLYEWYSSSWFSDDNEYFSFLQYAVKENIYEKIVSAVRGLKFEEQITDELFQTSEEQIEFLKKEFAEYCLKNSAHLSFLDEIKKIEEFEKRKLQLVGGSAL